VGYAGVVGITAVTTTAIAAAVVFVAESAGFTTTGVVFG
jgi:hypothetical protein